MPGAGRVAIGSVAGAIVAAICAPLILPLFEVPTGGVGFVTVHHYPKGWDYAVVALIVSLSAIGGALSGARRDVAPPLKAAVDAEDRRLESRRHVWLLAVLVFLFMAFAHD